MDLVCEATLPYDSIVSPNPSQPQKKRSISSNHQWIFLSEATATEMAFLLHNQSSGQVFTTAGWASQYATVRGIEGPGIGSTDQFS